MTAEDLNNIWNDYEEYYGVSFTPYEQSRILHDQQF